MRVNKKALAPVLAGLVVVLVLSQVAFAIQQPSEKVFWMLITEVPIDKLPQYHAISAQESMPLFEEHGYTWVATWQTIIGDIEEVVSVAEFENIGAYHRARVSLLRSPGWEQLSTKIGPLLRSTKSRLLSATPYSPLQ